MQQTIVMHETYEIHILYTLHPKSNLIQLVLFAYLRFIYNNAFYVQQHSCVAFIIAQRQICHFSIHLYNLYIK